MSHEYIESYLLSKGHYDINADGSISYWSDEESDWWSELEREWKRSFRKLSPYEAKRIFFPRVVELDRERGKLDKDEIRSKIDMVALYLTYFPNSRISDRGTRYRQAQCGFHDDKTASLSIDTEKKRFNCFGCGKKGDCFNLVMETENVSFMESLAILERL